MITGLGVDYWYVTKYNCTRLMNELYRSAMRNRIDVSYTMETFNETFNVPQIATSTLKLKNLRKRYAD